MLAATGVGCGAHDRRDDRAAGGTCEEAFARRRDPRSLQSRSFEVLSPTTSASKSTRGIGSAWPLSSAPNVRISVAARDQRDFEQPLEVAAARQQRTVQLLELPLWRRGSRAASAAWRASGAGPAQLPLTPLGLDPWGIAPVGLGVIMGCMSSTAQILKIRGGGRHGTRGGATLVQTPAEPSGHCGVHRGMLYPSTAVSLCVLWILQSQSR